MKKFRASHSPPSFKAPTDIAGLNEILPGGPARERITLLAGVAGGPGCSKSVLALQAFTEAGCQRGIGLRALQVVLATADREGRWPKLGSF